MKKHLLTYLFLTSAVIFFVSMSFDEDSKTLNKNFIFSFLDESPTLPDVPFAYSDISFPSHFGNDTIQTGYDGEVDTTILDFVNDDKSTLGRVLFYDKKLSALENMSCGTCHKQQFSFAENKDLSQGISTLTKRNSLQLNDLGWTHNEGFFWDMSFGDMKNMIGLPLKDPNEVGAVIEDIVIKMNNTDYYPELFEKAYGDFEITEDRIVESIVHFISSMTTFNSKFDQEAEKNFSGFTAQEKEGLQLFSFNCATCHSEGSIFGINNPDLPNSNEIVLEFPFIFTNGLEANPEDKGVGEWAPGMDGLYKVTTMRNIELTAPYMHDGRFETLDEVLDFYSDDVVMTNWNFFIPEGGFNFSSSDKAALKAFLLTLTDESFKTEVRWSDPFNAIVPVKENKIENLTLSVSPNPMNTFAIIEIENPTNEEFKLELYDEIGRLVKSDKFSGTSYQMDKNALNSGFYNIVISNQNSRNNIKLIVQ